MKKFSVFLFSLLLLFTVATLTVNAAGKLYKKTANVFEVDDTYHENYVPVGFKAGLKKIRKQNHKILRARCTSCPEHGVKKGKTCEHHTRNGTPAQRFTFPENVDNFVRYMKVMKVHDESENLGMDYCVNWNFVTRNTSDYKMALKFKGSRGLGASCDSTKLCKSWTETEDDPTCPVFTGLSCNSTENSGGKCQLADKNLTTQFFQEENLDIDGCLNGNWKGLLASSGFPKEDGKALYNEPCRPFMEADPKLRCMMVSETAVIYNTSSRSQCPQPTHLTCDPILQKCLCGREGYPDIQFQFGNRSKICYIRPTFPHLPGYRCPVGSVSTMFRDGQEPYPLCSCENAIKGKYFVFNSDCKDWWQCAGCALKPAKAIIIAMVSISIIYVSIYQ